MAGPPGPDLRPIKPAEWIRIVGSLKFSGMAELKDLAERHRGVSATYVKAIAFRAAAFADFDTGENMRPGAPLLAAECEVTVRTVEVVLRLLVDLGLLEVTRRGGGRGRSGAATVYRLTAPADLVERLTYRSPTVMVQESLDLSDRRR